MRLSLLSPRRRRQVRWAVLLLVMLLFATHPEVRLMLPVLDAIGLDVVLMLLTAQLLSAYADAMPMLRGLRYAVVAPALQWLANGSRRWPVCRNVRAWTSRTLRRARLGRQLWISLHVLGWALVRRTPAPSRRPTGTPMTEPSCVCHLPPAQTAATVAATFFHPS
ncbi:MULTISPECIES: hypothetical protein [Pseudoxanthomonas]|uniref:Uncharacterized protein n=1 Tax=Pseudoxanthomonas winnipegensis TaxID=2480810 RepID=A0AAW8GHX0_9GAMM|nr:MULTISPECIES: hypothetical protein [Pseudoxanthomonas]MDQ1120571.1 hypothetical protein [Pseudoxanthomonas winnipegensis]MDQ1133792.1 hypothetical protein [Pseudoxanthomonas winnipegensis]MDR6139968.1 hypothetical protein [Pseudoxanthomonas sp. SORGH_AS_0997]